MHELLEKITKYQETGEDKYYVDFLLIIRPLMLSKLKKVDKIYKEDLYQELSIKSFMVVKNAIIDTTVELDYKLFDKKMYEEIISRKNFKGFNELFKAGSLEHYLNDDKINYEIFIKSFHSFQFWKYFSKEYAEYVASKKILKLLDDKFNSAVADFYRSNGKYLDNELLFLNTLTENGNEIIDFIAAYTEPEKITLEESGIDKEDAEFLVKFINGDELLTQTEVAKKYNISQQAISNRLKKIKEKYKK